VWSAISTDFCRKLGSGIVSWYAGLPWFQQFWGRDLFWVIPSLLALGYHESVKRSLEYFSMVAENGRVPNQFSENEGRDMNALDPTLLWVTGLEDYVTQSGDLRFLEKLRPRLEETMRYILSRDTDGDGYLEHDREFPETWMDTLKRDSNAVEIQALACGALAAGERLLGHVKSDDGLLDSMSGKRSMISEGLERDFFHEGFFVDRFFWKQKVPTRTANSLVPLILGFTGRSREILRAIESERFTNPVGVRTRAEGEAGYDPKGYHTGQTWSLTTAWASAAEFASGRKEKGWRYLKLLLDDMERDALGCVGESWDSSSLSLTGCSLQLWGSGFVPRLVDESMLGIRINSLDRTIRVNPQLPRGISSVERVRQTGLGPVRLRFRKSRGRVKAACSNSKFRLISP
jgi:glycogen debranching enzyme